LGDFWVGLVSVELGLSFGVKVDRGDLRHGKNFQSKLRRCRFQAEAGKTNLPGKTVIEVIVEQGSRRRNTRDVSRVIDPEQDVAEAFEVGILPLDMPDSGLVEGGERWNRWYGSLAPVEVGSGIHSEPRCGGLGLRDGEGGVLLGLSQSVVGEQAIALSCSAQRCIGEDAERLAGAVCRAQVDGAAVEEDVRLGENEVVRVADAEDGGLFGLGFGKDEEGSLCAGLVDELEGGVAAYGGVDDGLR